MVPEPAQNQSYPGQTFFRCQALPHFRIPEQIKAMSLLNLSTLMLKPAAALSVQLVAFCVQKEKSTLPQQVLWKSGKLLGADSSREPRFFLIAMRSRTSLKK